MRKVILFIVLVFWVNIYAQDEISSFRSQMDNVVPKDRSEYQQQLTQEMKEKKQLQIEEKKQLQNEYKEFKKEQYKQKNQEQINKQQNRPNKGMM